jgi:ABC-type glycerol-3-phosphate transport system permease component
MMGLMYRLVLHEFAGPMPALPLPMVRLSPAFLSRAHVFSTVVVAETLQWTPFAFLLFLTAYQAIPQTCARRRRWTAHGPWRMFWKIELPLMAAHRLCRAVHPVHRRVPGVRQHLHPCRRGPGGITTSMSIYIYEAFLRQGDIGRAMAAAILLFRGLHPAGRGAAPLMRGRHEPPAHNLRWLVFAVAAFVMNFPVLATLITAFKSPGEVSRNPSLWIEAPTLENFATVLTVSDRLNVYHYLWNSLTAALIGAILPMVVAFPLAWAMARRGYGRALLVPARGEPARAAADHLRDPALHGLRALGLLDTRLGLGLILAIVNLPLALMLLVNAVADLPVELEEAARVDGARLPRLLRDRPAALPPGADHHLRLRLHHRLERIPLRPDADHARGGADDRGRVVLLRHLGRRGAMGRGGGGDDRGGPAAAGAGPRDVSPDHRVDGHRRGKGLSMSEIRLENVSKSFGGTRVVR